MKRSMFGFALTAMFVATPLATGTAAAAGPITTTITLSCKNVDAQVTLTLQSGGTDLMTVPNMDLNCGPNSLSGGSRTRVVVTTTAPADAVNVTQFEVVAVGGATGQCEGPSALPDKVNCAPFGNASAQLVVR
jgi:hypothetical protein